MRDGRGCTISPVYPASAFMPAVAAYRLTQPALHLYNVMRIPATETAAVELEPEDRERSTAAGACLAPGNKPVPAFSLRSIPSG